MVLGATNLPWALDPAVRRRLEKRIYISLPETEARAHLLKACMKNTPNELVDSDYMELAHKTEM